MNERGMCDENRTGEPETMTDGMPRYESDGALVRYQLDATGYNLIEIVHTVEEAKLMHDQLGNAIEEAEANKSDGIPEDDLRELIERLKTDRQEFVDRSENQYNQMMADNLKIIINELEAMLDE